MKMYRLIRRFVLTGVTSLVLTTTGCNSYNEINDKVENKYVVVVDGEIKLVEELSKNIYKDIITGSSYNKSNSIEIKGKLNEILSFEEIMEIDNASYFSDADWTELYEKIRNRYQVMWGDVIKNEERFNEIESFSSSELGNFEYEYSSLISCDDIYILDTSLCEIENPNNIELDKYYLFTKNYNPINNSNYDSERLFFDLNSVSAFGTADNFLIDLGNGIKFRNKDFSETKDKEVLFRINDFYRREGFFVKKDGYTVLELEQLMERINKKEVKKIDSNRVYVFDASVSDIDILPICSSSDISSLEIDNYYILIQDDVISNTFSTLSNNEDNILLGDIYINDDSKLVSSSKDFMFVSDVDLSYNLMNINDFFRIKGLDEYIEDSYSIGKLNKLDWSLNEIELKASKSRKLI